MSRDCCVAIPLSAMSAMGLSAVCDCDTHSLFLNVIHANSDGFGESAHLLGLVLNLRHSSKFSCGDSSGD